MGQLPAAILVGKEVVRDGIKRFNSCVPSHPRQFIGIRKSLIIFLMRSRWEFNNMINKQTLESWYQPKPSPKEKWKARMGEIRKIWKERGYTFLTEKSYFEYSLKERAHIRERIQARIRLNKKLRIEKHLREHMMDYPFSFRTN